jgi:hypothetical protein
MYIPYISRCDMMYESKLVQEETSNQILYQIEANSTIMVIQQCSRQSFQPHHPGGYGEVRVFFKKKNSVFILSLFSFRFLTFVSCVFGQTARACTHPHELGLAWGNALVIHSAARFSRSTTPRPDRTVDLSSFQTVRFERNQPGT